MLKAYDLVKKQSQIENYKIEAYENLYTYIEKKIQNSSISNNYYTWYSLPECLIGYPMYHLQEAKKYVTKLLKENGFSVEFYEPNILFISWFPDNVKKEEKIRKHKKEKDKIISVYKPDEF